MGFHEKGLLLVRDERAYLYDKKLRIYFEISFLMKLLHLMTGLALDKQQDKTLR